MDPAAAPAETASGVMAPTPAESQLEVGAFVLALILLGLLLRKRRLFLAGVAALVAAGVAVVANVLVAHLWYRQRPFVAHPHLVHLIVHHPADASFPSDHSAALAAISVALLYFLRPLGILAVLWTLAVGFARVYVGEHYPGDVLGGYAIGILAGVAVLAAVRSHVFTTRVAPRLSFLTS
jgi:undecaprenyl-diphosphatase